MLSGQKIVVVMPAYNAARTLQRTYDEVMEQGIVDLVIVVDDASHDETAQIARTLKNVQVEVHPENRGYGGNQKTCYRLALAAGADIVVMIHPDYQYTPQLLPAMASLVESGLYPCVLASRILGGGALDGGMPWWKYIANRFLTLVENFLIGAKLSEYHTGYRAFARSLLERLPIEQNSDDFVFDNQMLAQVVWLGCKIGEVTCPAKYLPEGSSINFRRITIAVCIFLTAIVWVVFSQTLGHDFVNFDDDRYVYENPEVSRGLTIDGLKWLLTHSHASLWHPLTTLSHMTDCQIYGLKAGGHHFTNVVLHNIGAVLLFLVFRGMTGCIWRSAFIAAIFAIHPMRVESVAWVAERKDVLSGVFFMLTLGAYRHYTRVPSLSRYVTMSIFLVCGLMSKATFVTVPFVLLLLDYWPLQRANNFRAWQGLAIEKIPLFVLSAAASLATLFAQTVTMASLDQLPVLPRLKNAVVGLIAYIRQIFWPTDLRSEEHTSELQSLTNL